MRDPYVVLGVASDADKDEIKGAFRRQAKLVHPDQNREDFGAQERFAELNAAYQLLGNPQKRALFDKGLIDARGKRTPTGFNSTVRNPFAGFTMNTAKVDPTDAKAESAEDIAKRIFGDAYQGDPAPEPKPAARPQEKPSRNRREDDRPAAAERRETVKDVPGIDDIPLDDRAAEGVETARGTRGWSLFDRALRPLFGWIARPSGERSGDHDLFTTLAVSLEDVFAGASVPLEMPDGRTTPILLERGTVAGTTLRLRGEGLEREDGTRGDAVVTIRFAAHDHMRAEDFDLHLDVPVSLEEAVFGKMASIETLDGRAEIEVPAWSGSDRMVVLEGRGLPKPETGRGDLVAHIRIMLAKEPDQKLIDLLQLRKGEWYV